MGRRQYNLIFYGGTGMYMYMTLWLYVTPNFIQFSVYNSNELTPLSHVYGQGHG